MAKYQEAEPMPVVQSGGDNNLSCKRLSDYTEESRAANDTSHLWALKCRQALWIRELETTAK